MGGYWQSPLGDSLVGSFMHRVRNLRAPALVPPVAARVRRTPRLLLRPYTMGDLESWLAIEHDESVRRALRWPERSTSEATDHLRARTQHTLLRHVGDLLVLAAEHRGQVIGDVSLHLRTVAAETRSVEIGWLLRSEFRGQGLATEAAEAMLCVAFDDTQAALVTAVVAEGNDASAKLALRLGFRLAASRAGGTTYVMSREDHLYDSQRPSPRDVATDTPAPPSWSERRAG